MNELIGINDIEVKDGQIVADFTERAESIKAKVDLYKGVQFTEDSKKEAKAVVAELRKDQKELQSEVKRIKELWMKPFNEFSEKVMGVINLYNEPINLIDAQVKEFEEKRKAEKRAHIEELYLEMVDEEIRQYAPLDKIYNARWENATMSDSNIREDMLCAAEVTKSNVMIIKSFHSDIEDEAISEYVNTRCIAPVMVRLKAHEEMKEKVREQERQRELERIREETRKDLINEMKLANARQEAVESFIPSAGGEEMLFKYLIYLNEDGKQKLEAFMDSVGIRYECR